MNILFAIHHPVFGGPHNQAAQLALPLRSEGFQTLVLVPCEEGNAGPRLAEAGVETITMPLHRFRAPRRLKDHVALAARLAPEVASIRRVIREREIGLVQVAGLANPHAAVAARLEGVPVVWQLVDTRPPPALRRVFMPLVLSLADVLMTTGTAVARAHPGATALGPRLVPFVPPVDTDRFHPSETRRAAARRELGIPVGARVVGTLANLNPQKGHEYLIRAAAAVRAEHPELYLCILGAHTATHADYERALRSELDGFGFARDAFTIVDPGSRAAELLPALDVFVLASVPNSEGLPTSILEAIACALPVVATDVGGVREIVDDGVTGLVVPAQDVSSLAERIGTLVGDPNAAARLGEAARRRALTEFGIGSTVEAHVRAYRLATERRARTARASTPPAPPPPTDILACPACGGSLLWSGGDATCAACAARYETIDGIAVLLPPTEIDAGKLLQAEYFDRDERDEFQITRPHGAPRLYRHFMREKFRRATTGFEGIFRGSTALVVCGGSGMDAEFLAQRADRVITSDISLGAARRALARSRRYGAPFTSIVADVERLPFADRAIDVVFVHDGLHHLEDPAAGVAEMARVARVAVSITEPARATVTALAVRLGIALEREEAGNRVARFDGDDLAQVLSERGFRVVRRRRYAMYYRHEPGVAMRALSRRGLFPIAAAGFHVANAIGGRFGNKLSLVAVRK